MTATRRAFELGAIAYEQAKRCGLDPAYAMREAFRVVSAVKDMRDPTEKERGILRAHDVPPWVPDVIASVGAHHGMPADIIVSTVRTRAVARVRDEVIWRLRQGNLSTPVIGIALNRDHSSIHLALERFTKRMSGDELLRKRMTAVEGKAAA